MVVCCTLSDPYIREHVRVIERMTVNLKCMLQLIVCPELTGIQLWLTA